MSVKKMSSTEFRGAVREDLRIRKTKKALTAAFIELLSEKPFEQMTVNELCSKADIRRTTFYKYYKDKFDYLSHFVASLRKEFDNIIWKNSKPMSTTDYYVEYAKHLINFCCEHESLVYNIYRSPLLPAMLTVFAEQNFNDTYIRLQKSEQDGMKLHASKEIVASSCIGIVAATIYMWLSSKKSLDRAQLTEEISEMVRRCIE